jgi:hypothetical protein
MQIIRELNNRRVRSGFRYVEIAVLWLTSPEDEFWNRPERALDVSKMGIYRQRPQTIYAVKVRRDPPSSPVKANSCCFMRLL